ncbi:MAG: putative photosynthetic complex assembly protein PuhE [Pseudolabrys sp.]|nr:putative photosynthetic complex assembly protein PuhE [Pseudolabrys sp.]
MSQIALPALYALLLWWFSTGIILYAVGLSRRSYRVSVAISAVCLIVALWALAQGGQATARDAYVTFACVLAVWGFVETTFLTGYITGPRKTPCPPGCTGARRVRYATETIIYHELMLVAGFAAIVAATGGGDTFAIGLYAMLWVMRLSSKLNLFLGVPTLNAELLPPPLRHLRSYFRQRPMNALFPVSALGSAAVTAWLVGRAFSDGASDYDVTVYILMASLLALGLLEHLFMLIPMPIAGLWGPQIKARAEKAEAETAKPAADLASVRAQPSRKISVGGVQ